MISKIILCDEKYYYKGKEYGNYKEFLSNKLSKSRKLILCSHAILIKKYKYYINDINKFISDKISEDFTNKDNLLFNYEIDKENKIIYLYSIRNDFKNLYDDTKELNIDLVQFNIKNNVKKKIRISNDKIIVFNIKNSNHLLKICNGFIVDSIINKDVDMIKDYIKNENDKYLLIKDNKFPEIDNVNFDYSIDLGVGKFEKVCKE